MKSAKESDVIYFKIVAVLLLASFALSLTPGCRGSKPVKPNDAIEHRK